MFLHAITNVFSKIYVYFFFYNDINISKELLRIYLFSILYENKP